MSESYGQVLLDTHAAIWFVDGSLKSEAAEAIIFAGQARGALVSPVTAWEIGLLARARGDRPPRMRFDPNAGDWLTALMRNPVIASCPLTHEMALAASALPGELQGDPADRLLIATARALGVPLVTRDEDILAYAALGFLKVIPC